MIPETDTGDGPELEPDDDDPVVKLPDVQFQKVEGAEGLPDEVKDGEIPQEEP